jgi:riboflavin biosynthesis pyrimidine reductase
VHGSGNLVGWLLDNQLVNEIILLVCPAVIARARGRSPTPARRQRST